MEADKFDQLENADMTKSMWSEAYNNYINTSSASETHSTKKLALEKAQASLSLLLGEVNALKLKVDAARLAEKLAIEARINA